MTLAAKTRAITRAAIALTGATKKGQGISPILAMVIWMGMRASTVRIWVACYAP